MKIFRIPALLAAVLLSAAVCAAQTDLDAVLPLLQAKTRTAAQNKQVMDLFATSKNPNTVFAAGASLVRLPPPAAQQAKLFNMVIKDTDMLKKTFAAVILTAMGAVHTELSPLLADAAQSKDNALRAYAASAYTILNPQDMQYTDEIVNLYIYDPALAQRAMNLISSGEKQTLKLLKQAAKSEEPQVRAAAAAWMGALQSKDAAKQLLKMAKTELNPEVSSSIAAALAQNAQWTLPDTAQGLKTRYESQPAATYALALGFMTGNALEEVKHALDEKDLNRRVNAARAAAYMAGVLASADAARYSADPKLDAGLLKALLPQLGQMVKKDQSPVKIYAENAMKQISRLIEL